MRKLEDTRVVYVILNLETSRVKIGVSVNVKNRIESLRCASGCNLKVLYTTPFIENPFGLELRLHRTFSKYRYLGEWFTIDHAKAIEVVRKFEKDFIECEVCGMFNRGRNPTSIANKIGVSRSGVVSHLTGRGYEIKAKSIDEPEESVFIDKMKPIIIPVTSLSLSDMVSANNKKIQMKKALEAQRLNLKIDLHTQY